MTVKCPKCGGNVELGKATCWFCGQSMAGVSPSPRATPDRRPQAAKPASANQRSGVAAFVGVFAVAMGVYFYWMMPRSKHPPRELPPEAPPVAATPPTPDPTPAQAEPPSSPPSAVMNEAQPDVVQLIRSRVAACGDDVPTRTAVEIGLTLNSDGEATEVSVGPPLEGTPAERCVQAAVRSVHFRGAADGTRLVLSVEVGGADAVERLQASDIIAGMNAVKEAVTRCDDAAHSGSFKVRVSVGSDGSVTHVSVGAPLAGTSLERCIKVAVRAAHFKKSKDGITFSYPYVFP